MVTHKDEPATLIDSACPKYETTRILHGSQ